MIQSDDAVTLGDCRETFEEIAKANDNPQARSVAQMAIRMCGEAERYRALYESAHKRLDRFRDVARAEAANEYDEADSAKYKEVLADMLHEIGDYTTDGLDVVLCGIKGETIRRARAALGMEEGGAK